ncbi:MAG: flagellin, partial [Bradymonadales bacterium]
MRINTNTLSINAQRNLGEVSRGFQRALERLSSGSRISRAGDDAAGLAISNGIESEVRGLRQATRNINDAFGFFTTSEGAIRTQTEIVQRMRELAVQASNGAIGSKERGLLNTELQELLSEFHRIASQTSFNGTKVLAEARNFQLQVGNRGTNQIEVGMKS